MLLFSKSPELTITCLKERRSVVTAPKHPAISKLNIQLLSNNFGAPDFLVTLSEFVSTLSPASQYFQPTRNDTFGVFKKIAIHLGDPLHPGDVIINHVHAAPSKGPGPLRNFKKLSSFDIVLVRQVSGE